MLSRCLRVATRSSLRNYSRIHNNNFNKYHFEKTITQFHRWESNQSKYTPHVPYSHDSNKGSKHDMSNILNQQTRDKDNNAMGKPTQHVENMPFNQKLNKIYNKHPYANERESEGHNENPLDVMYENVAKDEDINAKDNHLNEDSNAKSSTNERHIGKDSLYDMALIENDQLSGTTSRSNFPGTENRQQMQSNINNNTTEFNKNNKTGQNNNQFHKVNQDENFNDVYVGDVEHKIPSKNLNAHHKQIVTEHIKNKDIINKEKLDENAGKKSPMHDDQQRYTVDDHDTQKNEQQKNKIIASNVDLDLSTGTFHENMKKYEKQMSSSDDHLGDANLEKTPSNEDYYLKDNNSEYNNFIVDNQNKNEDHDYSKKIDNRKNKKQSSKDYHSKSSEHDDYDNDRESDDSSRNKQM